MIKTLTLELDVLPIDQLVLTEKSQWIWATHITQSWHGWNRIRVWQESRYGNSEKHTIWSYAAGDISHNQHNPIPYTHYVILPTIEISVR